jgi:predicted alpha/beta-fold hydrolase
MRDVVAAEFRPPWWLSSPHVQSILASSALRRLVRGRFSRRLEHDAQWVTLDCGDGVRLTGCHTAQRSLPRPRGLAVLFHGWEGSTRSTYLLQTGARLLGEGWDVFRLNFRDHGGSHALNPGIFHSCRIDEVVGALRALQSLYPVRPMTLTGFSLGGNFALRVALRAPGAGLELAHAVAVCPVINPHSGLFQLEHAPRMYHDYFMWKWRRSLRAKQRAFADSELFSRRDLAGTLHQPHRLGQVPALAAQDSQQMQNLGVVGIVREELAVTALGLVEASLAVQLQQVFEHGMRSGTIAHYARARRAAMKSSAKLPRRQSRMKPQ